MDNSIWGMLNDGEKALLRETDRAVLETLDEDALVELHTRVRRVRNKYTKLYRRRAGEQVEADRTRSGAHRQHARTLVKAEAFEEALGLVSKYLGRAAAASAAALKAERLAAARGTKPAGTAPRPKQGKASTSKAGAPASSRRSPASEKRRASTKATTARRQKSRDAR